MNSRIFSVKNISKDELSAFRAIRDQIKSGHITVRKADKSRQVVLMNIDAYVKAVTDLLSSPSYEKVAFNGKFKCSALIIQTIKKYAEALTTSERCDQRCAWVGSTRGSRVGSGRVGSAVRSRGSTWVIQFAYNYGKFDVCACVYVYRDIRIQTV